MSQANESNQRIPPEAEPPSAELLAEVASSVPARAKAYRERALHAFYNDRRPAIIEAALARGLDRARAHSYADRETRRLAEVEILPLEAFAAPAAGLVYQEAAERLASALRDLAESGSRSALADLRRWGVSEWAIAEAKARRRGRIIGDKQERIAAAAQRTFAATPGYMAEVQAAIIRDEVPRWMWRHDQVLAPGVGGFAATTRTGTLHIWTLVADPPLTGAGGRYLDGLPRDQRIRVFGVTYGSLAAQMLARRGFEFSRYRWNGKREGRPVSASAWSWMYR